MSIADIRKNVFRSSWPLDDDLTAISERTASHSFLANPSGQYPYIYLTRFVSEACKEHFGDGMEHLALLDWGCGKGHVSKLLRALGATCLESCDIQSDKDDSSFAQATPILDRFGIRVTALSHDFMLPYDDKTFDVVLSVGVLEHVKNDSESLAEIARILKPRGLFFCFFLPSTTSWTQRLAHARGDYYHDRLYSRHSVIALLERHKLNLVEFWRRQLFPKNSVRYPAFRSFERLDHLLTEHTPLGRLATNIEFVAVKRS